MTIAKVYGKAMQAMANKQIDFDSDTVKVLLCTSTYTPNQDTHDYVDTDITNELTGGGYARVTLTGKTVTYDGASNTLTLDCDNVLFPALTAANVRYAVFFIDTGTPATSPLLCYWDFESNLAPSAQDLTLTISASGLVTAVAA